MQEAGRSSIRRQQLQHYQGAQSGNPRRQSTAVARRAMRTNCGLAHKLSLEGGKENRPKAIKCSRGTVRSRVEADKME